MLYGVDPCVLQGLAMPPCLFIQSEEGKGMFDVAPREIVVNLLRADYRDWLNTLSQVERDAIHKYSRNSIDKMPTDRFFVRLNALLRGEYNRNDSDMLRQYAGTISNAIQRQPLKRNVVLYRGTDVNQFQGLELGSEVKIDQFFSTSVIDHHALHKRDTLVIYAPIGTRGAYIEQLSAYPKQREFLLDKGNVYKLIDIEEHRYILEVMI